MIQTETTALALSREIREKKRTVRETVQETLKKIHETDSSIGAFLTLRPEEELLEHADRIQQQIDDGTLNSPLAGVPVAVQRFSHAQGLPVRRGAIASPLPRGPVFTAQKRPGKRCALRGDGRVP